MVTVNQLATYRRVQKRIEADFERDLRAIWAKASTLDPVRSARLIEQAFPTLIDKYGLQAASVAADWFEALTGVHATVPDSFKPEAFQASARWAVGERFTDTAKSVAVGLVADRLVSSGVRHVRQHARDTIDASARNSGGRVFYARKVMGETCDFCLILASRGPVYGSETSARLRGADGNVYHDDCDCQVVPVKGEWVADETSPRGERWVGQDPGYDFEKLYAEEYKPYWNENDNIKDVLAKKRKVIARARTSKSASKGISSGSVDGSNYIYSDYLKSVGVTSHPAVLLDRKLTPEEIIARVGGGDLTDGSCMSLAYAYAANKAGYDVLDFRGGESGRFFASAGTTLRLIKQGHTRGWVVEEYNGLKSATNVLKNMQPDKEYILGAGKHAAVVRLNDDGKPEYLELQSEVNNGWHRLTTSALTTRFGVKKSSTSYGIRCKNPADLVDIDELVKAEQFKELLPFINTHVEHQTKGAGGHEK